MPRTASSPSTVARALPRPIGPRALASLWRKLMTEVLGYSRFAAQGGDYGSGISRSLGGEHADVTAAIHLNLCIPPMHEPPQSEAEAEWRKAFMAVQQRESAYMLEHMTTPQTVAAAISNSRTMITSAAT